MSWRAPWLRERLLLLLLAVWDLLVVWGMYAFTYRQRLGQAPGNPGFAAAGDVLAWWLLFTRSLHSAPPWLGLEAHSAAGFAGVGLLLCKLRVGIADSGTRLRSFLLPLLSSIAVGSGLGHQVLAALRPELEAVVLLCTEAERPILQAELKVLTARKQQQITLLDEH